jgi:hypothetical protein
MGDGGGDILDRLRPILLAGRCHGLIAGDIDLGVEFGLEGSDFRAVMMPDKGDLAGCAVDSDSRGGKGLALAKGEVVGDANRLPFLDAPGADPAFRRTGPPTGACAGAVGGCAG